MLNSLSSTDHERLSRFAALGVAALAAAACLYLLVRLLWLLLPRGADVQTNAGALPAAAPAAAMSVAKWHLFGNPQGLAAPAPNAALATVLKLALRGTLALPDARDKRAIAIIANEQGVETSYRVGADVAPGAKLAEVHADHVVLDHDGVAEALPLPRPEQHLTTASTKAPPRAGLAAPAASLPPGMPPGTSALSQPPSSVAAPKIDAAEFARQIRPVFDGGRIVGADISGADTTLLARVGLKSTDVVTAINGTPLANVSNPQALMDQLQNSPSIQVTVQRDGKPATLTLSLH